MTDTPDLEAVLESIRARVAGEVAPAPAPEASMPRKASRLLPTPLVDASGITVEALMTNLLEPMLRQWMDAHLPEICERIAQAEIRRLTGQP